MASMRDKLMKKTAQIGKDLDKKASAQKSSVQTSAITPKTAPGQMLAIRSTIRDHEEQLSLKDRKIAELETRLKDIPLGTALREEEISLSLIDESPYQPRQYIDPVKLDELGKSLSTAGLDEPVKVRIVTPGRYELISGHRRTTAARNIGWKTIRAIIVDMTDENASKSVLMQNESREDLSDLERAYIFRKSMESGLCRTQKETANYYGYSQPYVSACLSILALPDDFLDVIRQCPPAIGMTCVQQVHALLKDMPEHRDLILDGIRRIVHKNADQAGLKSWVKMMLTKPVADPEDKEPDIRHRRQAQTLTDQDDQVAFKVKIVDKHNRVQIDIEDKNIDPEEICKIVVDAIKLKKLNIKNQ